MNMIVTPSDNNRGTIMCSEHLCQVAMHVGPNAGINKKGISFFG
jgi:hypothetical protein